MQSRKTVPYAFDRADGIEERRLERQARAFDPLTERLFLEAGLAPGMRVLDMGSGAGDVAMLAARLVGPRGAVVGLEASSQAIATARRRARRAGHRNVRFLRGDIRDMDAGLGRHAGSFDAVVGRLVLAFVPDPAQVLRSVADRVVPGGIVCFQECDALSVWSYPATPLWERVRSWFQQAAVDSPMEPQMGLRLYGAFLAAGLAAPTMRLEAAISGGSQAPAFVWAGVVRALMPAIERLAIADAGGADPETLADCLLAETVAHDGVVIGPSLIGAWARTT